MLTSCDPLSFKSGITVVWLYLVAILRLPHFVLTLELRSVKNNLNQLNSLKALLVYAHPPFSPGMSIYSYRLHSVDDISMHTLIKSILVPRKLLKCYTNAHLCC
jgi:hypothetical protein